MGDVLERLRQPIWTEDVMKRWDRARQLIASGHTGSLPRDIIEADLDGWDQERAEAADTIEALRAERDEARNQLDSALHSIAVLEGRAARFRAERDAAMAEVERLNEAVWQALDDMAGGLSVCEATKRMMMNAFRPSGEPDDLPSAFDAALTAPPGQD